MKVWSDREATMASSDMPQENIFISTVSGKHFYLENGTRDTLPSTKSSNANWVIVYKQ